MHEALSLVGDGPDPLRNEGRVGGLRKLLAVLVKGLEALKLIREARKDKCTEDTVLPHAAQLSSRLSPLASISGSGATEDEPKATPTPTPDLISILKRKASRDESVAECGDSILKRKGSSSAAAATTPAALEAAGGVATADAGAGSQDRRPILKERSSADESVDPRPILKKRFFIHFFDVFLFPLCLG